MDPIRGIDRNLIPSAPALTNSVLVRRFRLFFGTVYCCYFTDAPAAAMTILALVRGFRLFLGQCTVVILPLHLRAAMTISVL